MNRGLAAVFVLAGGASYGLLASFVNLAYGEGYTVGEITGGQMFFGALFLWVVALAKRRTWKKLRLKTIIQLMIAGALNGLTGVLYYSSMQTLPASIAIVMLFQFTWIGVLYAWVFDRQRPNKAMYVALVFILIGTLFAADFFDGGLAGLSVKGALLGLLSAFTFAGFIFLSGRLATEVSPLLRSPIMMSGASILIFILFPPTLFVSGVLLEGLWKYTIVLAFLGGIVPTVCFATGSPKLKGGMATILGSIELPVAVVMAWIVLKESVHVSQWVGVCLILMAIIIGEVYAMRSSTHE